MSIPNDASQFSADQLVFPYKEYVLWTSYHYNSGLLQLPVAAESVVDVTPSNPLLTPADTSTVDGVPPELLGDRQPCVTVQVSAPYGVKRVNFRAVRQGIPPVLPDPTPTNPNEALLYVNMPMRAPKLVNNGQCYEWEVEGEMVYALAAPYWVADGLSGGSTPIDVSEGFENAIPATFFDDELPGVPTVLAPDPAAVEMTTLVLLDD